MGLKLSVAVYSPLLPTIGVSWVPKSLRHTIPEGTRPFDDCFNIDAHPRKTIFPRENIGAGCGYYYAVCIARISAS